MHTPNEYIEYLYLFHNERDYFECHEVLEDYWKENGMERNSIWVLFIQIAVGLYHHRRLNFVGAHKMYQKAIPKINLNQNELIQLGIDVSELSNLLFLLVNHASTKKPYSSIDLPIVDPSIIALYKEKVIENYQQTSDYVTPYIIHKHKLRDRTDVIMERKQAQLVRRHVLTQIKEALCQTLVRNK